MGASEFADDDLPRSFLQLDNANAVANMQSRLAKPWLVVDICWAGSPPKARSKTAGFPEAVEVEALVGQILRVAGFLFSGIAVIPRPEFVSGFEARGSRHW